LGLIFAFRGGLRDPFYIDGVDSVTAWRYEIQDEARQRGTQCAPSCGSEIDSFEFVEHIREWCSPGVYWCPTLSAGKCGKDGARKSTRIAKRLDSMVDEPQQAPHEARFAGDCREISAMSRSGAHRSAAC